MTIFCLDWPGESQSAMHASYNTGMSVAEGMPPAILLPANPDFRESRDRDARSNHLRRGAIVAAALAHIAVITAMIVHWPNLFPARSLERPPIPVTLVTEPPPLPPPQAKPVPLPPPPPPPPQQQQQERVSGADTKTTAPPPAVDKGEEAAPKPSPPPPTETHAKAAQPQAKPAPPPPPPPPPQQQQQERVSGADTKTTAPPPAVDKGEEAAPKPSPPPPTETQAKAAQPQAKPAPPQEKAKQEKPKVAKRETTPKPSRGSVNRAPGDRATEGDPYLNQLFSLIESHRTYPRNAIGSLGLPLEGTSVYLIAVRADGALANIVLERSSGVPLLDQTALSMIKRSAPFPPPPQSEFPGPGIVLEVTIHLFPGAG